MHSSIDHGHDPFQISVCINVFWKISQLLNSVGTATILIQPCKVLDYNPFSLFFGLLLPLSLNKNHMEMHVTTIKLASQTQYTCNLLIYRACLYPSGRKYSNYDGNRFQLIYSRCVLVDPQLSGKCF